MKLLLPFTLCLSALVMALGFSMCTNAPSPADSGLEDEREADVPTDTARDNGWVTADIAEADVPTDGEPQNPEWVPLPGMPSRCQIERAEHPERLTTIEWTSCGEGCEYLSPDPRYRRVVSVHGGSYVDGIGFFTLILGDADEPVNYAHRIVAIADTSGRIWAAWREPRDTADVACSVSRVAVGEGRAFVYMTAWTPDERQERIYSALLPELSSVEEPIVVFEDEATIPLGAVLERPRASASLFASEIRPGGHVLLVRPNGQFDKQLIGTAQYVQVVGDDVIFEAAREEDGELYRTMMHTRFGEEPSVLLDAADGHIAGATATADAITWQYATGNGRLGLVDSIELWTSPFATRREDLVPRRVRNLVPEAYDYYLVPFAGANHIITSRPTRAVRLSDGAVRSWLPAGDQGIAGNNGYLWFSENEVALSSVTTTSSPGTGTVVRLTTSTLHTLLE